MKYRSAVAGALLFFASTMHAVEAGDARALAATLRQRVETTDSRATGHLVRVDANGKRVSEAVAIKAHWFPGVLRVLLEVAPAQTAAETPGQTVSQPVRPAADQAPAHDVRESILFEMRPGGQSTVRVFHPHEAAPVSLPASRWGESVLGSDFDYEDFLQPEAYWQNLTFVKTAKLGNHECEVLKSTPGAADRTHEAEVQTWIDPTIGYPIYVEKTLKDGGIVKEFTSLGLRQTDGVWAARQVEVKIHGRPGSTLLVFDRGSTKARLTEKDFSPEQIGRFEDRP